MADIHTYKFNVTMSCGGCSGAINRVLGKLEGGFSSPLFSIFNSYACHVQPFFPQRYTTIA
jgi:copper chaperone CopZ